MLISLSKYLDSRHDSNLDLFRSISDALFYGTPSFLKASPIREQGCQFVADDIDFVLCGWIREGSYAETELAAIVKLLNGNWAAFEAGCDTTGWDCQS